MDRVFLACTTGSYFQRILNWEKREVHANHIDKHQ